VSEFHLQSLPVVDTLPKILELCRFAGYVFSTYNVSLSPIIRVCVCNIICCDDALNV